MNHFFLICPARGEGLNHFFVVRVPPSARYFQIAGNGKVKNVAFGSSATGYLTDVKDDRKFCQRPMYQKM
jgi:hypothetical protein